MAEWWLEDMNGSLHKALFSPLTLQDTKIMTTNRGWSKGISWTKEVRKSKNFVYKLTDVRSNTIQGAISMFDNGDHVFVDLIESAPQNRTNPRSFVNIARILIAFAGKRSMDIGAEGFIALTPKDRLYDYYVRRFSAFPIGRRNLAIADVVTNHWIKVYYR